MELSVILPAYKEADNLKSIMPRINTALEKFNYEVLIVDSMDPLDDTQKVCYENGGRYIARQGGNDYGDAIRTGIKEAKGEYIVVMDADGSHDPRDITAFYQAMKEEDLDLVIGSRYCKGGKTENPPILIFMSWALNVTYRVMFKLRVKDVSNSFRMYKNSEIKRIDLECQNFDIVEEILIKLSLYNQPFKVKEVPIYFNKRDKGESKRNLKKFIKSYISTMNRLMKIRSKVKSTKQI